MTIDPLSLSIAQIGTLLGASEGKSLDFETELRDPAQAAQLIAAMANSGGGRIVLGADEKGETVGLADPQEIQRIVEEAAQSIEPTVPLAFGHANLKGHDIAVVDVSREPTLGPFLAPEGAIVRRDDAGKDIPLSGSELLAAVPPSRASSTAAQMQILVELVGELNLRLATLDGRTNKGFKDAERGRRLRAQLPGWIISSILGAAVGAALTATFGL